MGLGIIVGAVAVVLLVVGIDRAREALRRVSPAVRTKPMIAPRKCTDGDGELAGLADNCRDVLYRVARLGASGTPRDSGTRKAVRCRHVNYVRTEASWSRVHRR